MKKSILVLISCIFFIFLASNASAFFIGLTDGYVYNNLGTPVSSATVTVTVSGCSGGAANGCTGSISSGSNGYYLVPNLNIPKGGTVAVTATKNSGTGSASGTADQFQVAHVNVTICYPPATPTLTHVPNGNNPSVTFSWTSGTDPLGLAKHDDFSLDSVITNNATHPLSKTGLSFSTHSWTARTCNNFCCSSFASADTFTLTCSAPTSPTLVNVPDSHNTTVTFSWTSSGVDPYPGSLYDIFGLDSNPLINATSPITRTNLSFTSHNWKVQTCNIYCCSAFSTDSFNLGNSPPSSPNNTAATPYADNITTLSWTSGIDPDGDSTYDIFQYDNGTNITNAISPINVTTSLLIKWKVQTCDSFGACSPFVSIESVICPSAIPCPTCGTCTNTCPTCPPSGGGSSCPPAKKTEISCNGIALSNETILKIKLTINRQHSKITINAVNYNLEDLEYCPWCYDGVKDYDETGIDCGGSCKQCGALESLPPIQKAKGWFESFIELLIKELEKIINFLRL